MTDTPVPAPQQPAATFLAPLLTALRRLDALLDKAIAAADAAYGAKATTDPYRGLYISPEEVGRLLAREPGVPALALGSIDDLEQLPPDSRFRRLAAAFGLIDVDLDVLLLALAPEVDLRYERLFAYLQDDVTRRRPSVDLALNLLCASRDAKFAARDRFMPGAPLLRHRLLSLVPDNGGPPGPLLAQGLRLDDAVTRFLLGHDALDQRLTGIVEIAPDVPAPQVEALDAAQVDRLDRAARRARTSGQRLTLYLEGPRGVGKRALAEVVAAAAQSKLMTIDAGRMADAAPDFEAALRAVARDARLHDAVVYLIGIDTLRTEPHAAHLQTLRSVFRDYPGLLVLSGEKPWAPALLPSGAALDAATVGASLPEFEARRDRWRHQASAAGFDLTGDDSGALASRFLLSLEQIDAAVSWAAGQRALGDERPDFFAAARLQSSHDLGSLARKIRPRYSWDDIILPADQVTRLREMCAQARHRHVVFGDWGFGRKLSLGKGLSALFSGPPGTGKTMAAEVIAHELQLDLYKIDLSQVVSKYIGETEKNLNRIFAEARASNAIIFFDEADALFGRRSEVKDAHDRYANIEVAYLLQKMDEYEGISILATNLRQNLDPAFSRRLSFTIEFPFPDEHGRRLIWQSIWPHETPLAADADLEFMATQFKLSGGSVKNIAVAAAFMAAEDHATVGLGHLLRATRREYEKMGRTVSRAEFGRYVDVAAHVSAV